MPKAFVQRVVFYGGKYETDYQRNKRNRQNYFVFVLAPKGILAWRNIAAAAARPV